MKFTVYIVQAFLLLLFFASPSAGGEKQGAVVMFDQGHRQRFLVEREGDLDLSRIAGLFREHGAKVEISKGPVTRELLAGVDVFVISGPFATYSADEIRELETFVEQGGNLSIMLHVGPPFASLLHHFGVAVSQGVIYEQENLFSEQQSNFRVTRLASHPVNNGLKRFTIYG
jgi:hypothetical protein